MQETIGRVALVTGASRGIGAALVGALLDGGAAKVYAAARDPDDLDEPARHWDGRVEIVPLDVRDLDRIAQAPAQLPDVDLLVSNAGVTCNGALSENSLDEYLQTMAVNFTGPMALTMAFGPQLRERRGGAIYILSLAALMPLGGAPIYCASKSACAMMALGARNELAPDGVGVTLVYPGYVDTRMGARYDAKKVTPEHVARCALEGWRRGDCSVFPDLFSELVRDALVKDMPRLLADPPAVRADVMAEFARRTRDG